MVQHLAGQPNWTHAAQLQGQLDALADGDQGTGEKHSSERQIHAHAADALLSILHLRGDLARNAQIPAADGVACSVEAIHASLKFHRLISPCLLAMRSG
jgi:hypothetical protein